MDREVKSIRKSKYLVFTQDIVLPSLIIIGVGALYFLTYHTHIFALQNIDCHVDYMPCSSATVIAELDKYKGVNLLTLKTSSIGDKLRAGDFTISSISFSKSLPGNLRVDITSAHPTIAIRVRGVDNEWTVLDANFAVLGVTTDKPPVPELVVDTAPTLQVGQKITDPTALKALSFAVSLKQGSLDYKSISLSGNIVTITLSSGVSAIVDLSQDTDIQIRRLQAILLDTTMDSGSSVIDVRFARPVLK